LFADLSDSTRLGGQLEAEDYAELLAGWRAICRDVIPRHGGLIARMQGDGLLAIFGYPAAREDDVRHACEAALELHAAVTALPVELPGRARLTAHSGIHGGLVLLAEGDIELGRFELLGDVPNIVARLSSLAAADDVLVSAETLGPFRHHFNTSARMDLVLKGRDEAMPAYRVLSQAALAGRFEAGHPARARPFVGRNAELNQLREHLRTALAGTPQCVVLAGEPGVGKTRLLGELLRHGAAAPFRVLTGYCVDQLSAEPLQPFAQMMRALHAAGDAAAVRAQLMQEAQLQPLLLVVDDWQWADEASRRLLDALLAACAANRNPVCALLTHRDRPDELTQAGATLMDLAPLSTQEAAALAGQLVPDADPFLLAEIGRYAGGTPLFVEELCHSAAASGAQGLQGVKVGGRAWLNALIVSRVERLPAEQAALVRMAAVLGLVFPQWLLHSLTGLQADSPAMQALAASDFIFPGVQAGTLRFKHGMTRDVIVEAVGKRERTALHRRVAQVLMAHMAHLAQTAEQKAEQTVAGGQAPGADELIEPLAYHCAAGALHAEAATAAERAGDKAMAASALDRARAQYDAALKALDATGPLDHAGQLRWCGIAQKLGMACVFDPLALADGLATFERGAALARASGDLSALAKAEYWLGYLYYAKGMPRRALPHCEAALNLAAQLGDQKLAAQVRATLGQALLSATQLPRARQLLDESLDAKRSQARPGSGMAVGSAYILACKGYALADRGQFSLADECLSEALQLLGDAPHQVGASVRHWISVVRHWQGYWEEAARMGSEAAAIAEQVKSRQQLAMGRALAGRARWKQSGQAQGLQALREATAWIDARKGGLAMSLNHGWLVEVAVAEGRLADARQHAVALMQRARQDDFLGLALGCRALAAAASAGGEHARAAHYLRQAESAAQRRESAHEAACNALAWAEWSAAQQQRGEAARHLEAARLGFETLRMWWHLEQAKRLADRLQ